MIVTCPEHRTFYLMPGETLTVVADGVSSGVVYRLSDAAGGGSQGITSLAANETKILGPFNVSSRFDVIPTAGFLTATQDLSANTVEGGAAGYRIARSPTPLALDGANPTTFAHGLTICLGVFVQLVGSSAPGLGTSTLTAAINGANVDVYGWKPTSATNPTLIATTGTELFHWFAIGT